MIRQKGSISVNSAGRDKAFENALAASKRLIEKKIGFLCEEGHPIEYVEELTVQFKEETGKVIFRDKKQNLKYCPCITKLVKFTDKSVAMPNDKRRNPFECAKVQYLLCRMSDDAAKTEQIRKKTTLFQSSCDDCYKLAMDGIFREGFLCL